MNRILSYRPLSGLLLTLLAIPVSAANPFFAFDNGVGRGSWTPTQQAETLAELGYAGIGYTGFEDMENRRAAFDAAGLQIFNLYVGCNLDDGPTVAPDFAANIASLKGSGITLWLTVQSGTPGKDDDKAVALVSQIGQLAENAGIDVALYPHFGFYVATLEDATRVADRVDRDNVGVTFNLCHELRAGNGARIGALLDKAAPRLALVSINGAEPDGDWDRLIQPLGRGAVDVGSVLQKLKALDYTGPIGLQCYNIAGDTKSNLTESMAAWRGYTGHRVTGKAIPKVIFDTDMTGDCDDCGAMSLLHALADNGEVEILGCIASYGGTPYVAGCVDAINTYHGRSDLPIGVIHEIYGRTESRYLKPIATDTARYGHDIVTKDGVPDHVTVYRQLLVAQPDHSVTIVTVGRLKALSDLLDSDPDAISDLSGIELVKKKCVQWVCMGGRYPNVDGKGEANFQTHGGSGYSKKAVANWPLPALFSGWEIGAAIKTGETLMNDSDYNPSARAYRLFLRDKKNRESWDQTAVLAAIRGTSPWWDVVHGGNMVSEDGINTWETAAGNKHAYLVNRRPVSEVTALIEGLMTQKPLVSGR